jgi:hypothetical protein
MPRTLIVVDDGVLMALELSHTLTEFGFAVLGQARTLAAARQRQRWSTRSFPMARRVSPLRATFRPAACVL